MSLGEKAPSFQVVPHAPQEPYLKVSNNIERASESILSIRVVDEYRKHATDLLGANPTSGFINEINIIKEHPLPHVNQGNNIELLKLNDYIRDVNDAAAAGDTKLFEKAVKHLIIFLG